jgi:hypothetical protein
MILKAKIQGSILTLIIILSIFPSYVPAGKEKEVLPSGIPIIWRNPGDVRTRNLFYGPGGREFAPQGPFKFVKNVKGGTQTQFVVQDRRAIKWRVKLGKESQVETVATRLLWAAGYFADPTYYFQEVKIKGLAEQSTLASDDDISGDFAYGARFEPEIIGEKFIKWSWYDNPFVGTKEFNGLRIMMALFNNWDLKNSNNRIAYDKRSGELRYMVHDIGACFGKTGSFLSRSKNDLDDYAKSRFIKEVEHDKVDLVLKSQPPWFLLIQPIYWRDRTRMEKVGKDIPRQDARWMGQLLGRLSDKQLQDAFRAAGYDADETHLFAAVLRERIESLKRL